MGCRCIHISTKIQGKGWFIQEAPTLTFPSYPVTCHLSPKACFHSAAAAELLRQQCLNFTVGNTTTDRFRSASCTENSSFNILQSQLITVSDEWEYFSIYNPSHNITNRFRVLSCSSRWVHLTKTSAVIVLECNLTPLIFQSGSVDTRRCAIHSAGLRHARGYIWPVVITEPCWPRPWRRSHCFHITWKCLFHL